MNGCVIVVRLPCSHAIAACAFCNLNYDDFVDPVYKLENIFKVYQHHFHSLGCEDTWPQYLGSHFMSDLSKHNRHQASRLLLEYIMRWTNQFQIGLRNTHYVEVKNIIVLTIHTNKYMTNIAGTFLCFSFICIVHFILIY